MSPRPSLLSRLAVLSSALVVCVLITGCTRQYFHESQAGDRYYQTATGDILRVSRSGYVSKNSEQVGTVQKATDGSDWDLKNYQVVSPSGHCLSVLSDEMRPTPCYALVWEVPLVILASPFTAIQDAFREGSLSVAGIRSAEIPPPDKQR